MGKILKTIGSLLAITLIVLCSVTAVAKTARKKGGGSNNTANGNDSLCRGNSGAKQTKPQKGGVSYCDMIYNTLKDSCTGQYVDQLATKPIEDMQNFCPGWDQIKGDQERRRLFLMNFVAAIVTTESHWNEKETGDGGKSKGFLQLTAATDRKHGCGCQKLQNEFDPQQNLACGTQMIVSFMAKDGTVGKGKGDKGARGIARSFGPFRDGRKERADIQRRISTWCNETTGGGSSAPPPESPPAGV